MSSKTPPPDAPYDEPEWWFPYAAMDIGDSFFIPTMKPAYMTYVVDTTSKKAGIRTKIYTVTEDGVLGIRAWRIK